MKYFVYQTLLLAAAQTVAAIQSPVGLVSRTGDQSVVLHWDRNTESNLSGYKVYRSLNSGGPFTLLTSSPVSAPGYCDVNVVNGQTNFYQISAVTTTSQESLPSITLGAVPTVFASDDAFMEYVQETSFDYFWYGANPTNGLVPDRSTNGSACSIAAVGFGLTAIGIGIDHGWISRTQGVARVLTTLNTFFNGPQGPASSGTIGYKGWFYHFLDMNTGFRAGAELSSIDTVLLVAGIIQAREFFDGPTADEISIRNLADAIVNRVDWQWMAQGTNAVSMGWFPESGFISNNWVGYCEGMILYCLGLGTSTNPLPATSWSRWTTGYDWSTNYGQSYVQFAPLFGHQYSHCWIDFRHMTDAYMASHNTTYFANSRHATLAQLAYAIANPNGHTGYSSNVWGLTACDGRSGYAVHGLPPFAGDDGTIAPTAAGSSIPFTPGSSLPTLRYMYTHFRRNIWSEYGFRDAFNFGVQWYDNVELGIDQGPLVVMIENYRTQRPWKRFMSNDQVLRGLQRAGFVTLPSVPVNVQAQPAQNTVTLSWNALPGRTYQVEYSTDMNTWYASDTGEIAATGPSATWVDNGPPSSPTLPLSVDSRFYRVIQFGTP